MNAPLIHGFRPAFRLEDNPALQDGIKPGALAMLALDITLFQRQAHEVVIAVAPVSVIGKVIAATGWHAGRVRL
jgi:hypothetical protein